MPISSRAEVDRGPSLRAKLDALGAGDKSKDAESKSAKDGWACQTKAHPGWRNMEHSCHMSEWTVCIGRDARSTGTELMALHVALEHMQVSH